MGGEDPVSVIHREPAAFRLLPFVHLATSVSPTAKFDDRTSGMGREETAAQCFIRRPAPRWDRHD